MGEIRETGEEEVGSKSFKRAEHGKWEKCNLLISALEYFQNAIELYLGSSETSEYIRAQNVH